MRVAVIGAGVAGLVAGRRLALAGHSVDVYERWPGLGGQAATIELDGARIEHYYHHLFTSDRDIAALYEELGIEDAIEWLPSSVAAFADGRLWPLTSALDLLRFRPLPLRSRLRTGIATLRMKRAKGGHADFEHVTAHDWIIEKMGPDAWRVVWGPLLKGKFGSRAEDISMSWLYSKLTVRGADDAGGEVLGYPRGSWEPLFERLREQIEAHGGRVLIDRPAAGISRSHDGRLRVAAGGPDSFRSGRDPRAFQRAGAEEYDAVLATVSNPIFESLLDEGVAGEVGEGYLSRTRSIDYHEALCLLLELDRPFSPHYWTNVSDTELPFIGLIEQTNLVPPERYGGRHYLYVANYLEPGDELLSLPFDELLERYEPGLRKMNPGYSRDWVRGRWVFREPDAQPIVDLGYAERIPPLQTGAPGLVLANTTQIYPEDRGTNYGVRLGERAASEIERSR